MNKLYGEMDIYDALETRLIKSLEFLVEVEAMHPIERFLFRLFAGRTLPDLEQNTITLYRLRQARLEAQALAPEAAPGPDEEG